MLGDQINIMAGVAVRFESLDVLTLGATASATIGAKGTLCFVIDDDRAFRSIAPIRRSLFDAWNREFVDVGIDFSTFR